MSDAEIDCFWFLFLIYPGSCFNFDSHCCCWFFSCSGFFFLISISILIFWFSIWWYEYYYYDSFFFLILMFISIMIGNFYWDFFSKFWFWFRILVLFGVLIFKVNSDCLLFILVLILICHFASDYSGFLFRMNFCDSDSNFYCSDSNFDSDCCCDFWFLVIFLEILILIWIFNLVLIYIRFYLLCPVSDSEFGFWLWFLLWLSLWRLISCDFVILVISILLFYYFIICSMVGILQISSLCRGDVQ